MSWYECTTYCTNQYSIVTVSLRPTVPKAKASVFLSVPGAPKEVAVEDGNVRLATGASQVAYRGPCCKEEGGVMGGEGSRQECRKLAPLQHRLIM